jgi:protein-S-isoprenylcysteine O-methyltransferase Ste14
VETLLVHNVLLALMVIVFVIALTYASVEFPRIVNSLLHGAVEFPGFDSGRDAEGAEAFIRSHDLRVIGYGSFAVVLVLIVVGLAAGKHGLSSLGAVALFLPVFGHFAMSMFFLAGLGMLRVIWMPMLDVSYDVLRLGDVSYVPYMITAYLPALLGADIRTFLAYLSMGIGILVFALGTLAWFRGRLQGREVADFWVYRFSRHPQYLGWILWSYGFMIYVSLRSTLYQFKLSYGVPSSLPWLLSTLVIVGVGLVEEIKMRREAGEEYETYRRRTPFLLPLPRWVSGLVAAPMRALLRNERPESGAEALAVVGLYAVLLVVLSVPFVVFDLPGRTGWWGFPYNVFPFR